ncbi:hypothetical protein [Microbulbifer epialgicus]|uniref:Phosphatidylinositol diacylglycerol-lyase n=1 Tax=Microbulbifer epialgicus TaxID=393907 RepID=A0ABV4P6E6_9GAMM
MPSLNLFIFAIAIYITTIPLSAETLSEWGERALNIQNGIDYDAPFSETTWPGTHNSFANNGDDQFWNIALNQYRTRSQQMEKGIRQLVYDVHYDWNQLRLCHNNSGFAGCLNTITGYKRLKHGLRDIADFLQENPNEVILLKFEITDSAESKLSLLKEELVTYVGSYIYGTTNGISNHGNLGSHGCTELPTDIITKSKVLSAGKNLIVFSTHGCFSNDGYNDLAFYAGNTVKRFKTYNDVENLSDTDRRSKMSRVFDGLVKSGASSSSNNDVLLQPNAISGFLDVGLNIIEIYGFDGNGDWNGDGEAPLSSHNLVWSWDASGYEPNGTGNCGKIYGPTNRFRDANCEKSFFAACRRLVERDGNRAYDDWIISSQVVTFSNADEQCLFDGNGEYFFATPRNKMELNILLNKRDSAGLVKEDLWINYEKGSSGQWTADIGEADIEMLSYCDAGGNGPICNHITTYLNLVQ